MAFETEPSGYVKTSLSDLQGCWENLRDSVVENFGFHDSERLLFHINEAMSWESVRNLQKMKSTLLVIRNISTQTVIPEEITYLIEDVWENLVEVLSEVHEGKNE